ncbi:MAG: phage holin family protein [Candidatus Levyibacteriota bacterium]
MKTLLRSFAIFLLALYFIPQFVPGFTIDGGFNSMCIGAIVLALMFLIIKPILNIISFPVNLLTMGLFSILTNALILYLLTILVPDITVQPFTYARAHIIGFITPRITFDTFFAYVFSAFVLSCIHSGARWLINND